VISLAIPPAWAAPLSGAAFTHAAAAYAAIERADLAAAEREARAARRLAPTNPDAVRLLVDVLVRRGDKAGALVVADLAVARKLRDGDLLARVGYLRADAGARDAAIADFRTAMTMPDASEQRVRELSLAVADQEAALGRPAAVLETLAPYARERSYAVQARRGFALFSLERHAEAGAAFASAAETAGDETERRAARKGLAQSAAALGDAPTARALVTDLAAEGTACDPDLIYLSMRIGDDRAALDMAEGAACVDRISAGLHLDLAYAAKRLSSDAEAVDHFSRGIDGRRGEPGFDAASEFALRREVDSLEREFGTAASLTSRLGRSREGGGDSAQFIVESHWQPRLGLPSGTWVQVYGRLTDSGPGLGAVSADDSLEGALGVRLKPLADVSLVVAAEKHFALESQAVDDWLLRAGWSGGFGLDLRPGEDDWTFERHYVEVGRYLRQDRWLAGGEASGGLTAALTDGMTGSLYIGGAFGYDGAETRPFSAAVGPGLALSFRFRETAHRAPASEAGVDVGYRLSVTPSDRVGGFYARFHLSL